MFDTLTITGLRLTGYHGVFEHERVDGQEFVIDVEVQLDTTPASASDSVLDTLDYSVLVNEVAHRVTGEPVNLIETLAEDIAHIALGHGQAQAVTVTVHKPQAPVGQPVSDIAITIHRKKA